MTNNDILRRLRYAFNINDQGMMDMFKLVDVQISRSQISDWLKKDDDPTFREISDEQLANFLNGLIVKHRGKKDGQTPIAEKVLSNNIILRKLKIALSYKVEDIAQIMRDIDLEFSVHEISAFFRKKGQHQYRPCKDQFLRNFIFGLQDKYRKRD